MSRRFKSRHGKVRANPKALPKKPVDLDDSNSYVDLEQPDRRIPNVLNSRFFAVAESADDPDELVDDDNQQQQQPADELKQKRAEAAASRLLAARKAQADAEAELADLGL